MDTEELYKISQKNNHKYLKVLRANPTWEELIVKDYLDDIGVEHIFQKGFLKPFHRIVDFYIPKKKLIIEVDGSAHKFKKRKDGRKDREWLSKRGIKTLRIRNDETYTWKYIHLINQALGRERNTYINK